MKVQGSVRRELLSRANKTKPLVWIGKGGYERSLGEVKRQLESESLIKVRVLKSATLESTKEEIAAGVAASTDSAVLEIKGMNFVLFRPKGGWKRYRGGSR